MDIQKRAPDVAFNPAAAFYQTIRMSFTALEFVIERDEKESQCPYNRHPGKWNA